MLNVKCSIVNISCLRSESLPRRFGDAGDFTVQSHLAEFHPADAEFAHIAFGAASEHTAVVQANRVGIARKFVECVVVASFFQFLAKLSVLCDHTFALQSTGNNRFFCHFTLYLIESERLYDFFTNGIPISFSKAKASASVLAEVTKVMSIPMIFDTLSISISGKMICSVTPTV
jgi:hypothetical protein